MENSNTKIFGYVRVSTKEQNLARLPEELRSRFYRAEPYDHVSYYGQILAAYLLEEDEA